MNAGIQKNTQVSFIQIVILIMLFLAGMDLFNKYYYLCFFSCLLFFVTTKKFIVTFDAFLLMILGISWLAFSPTGFNGITDIIRPFLYAMMYVMGLNFYDTTNKLNVEKEKLLKKTIILLALGPTVHFLLNWLYNRGRGEIIFTIDIWSKDILSATNQSAMACMMVGILAALLLTKMKSWHKLLSLFFLILIIVYNLMLGGRTLLFMIVICVVASLMYILFSHEIEDRKRKSILIIIVIIFVGYVAFHFNIFNIKDIYYNSGFYYRFFSDNGGSILDDSRGHAKFLFLKDFHIAMFGGAHLRESGIGYAHDILLDTYDEAGFFALVAVMVFLIRGVLQFWKFVKSKENSYDIKLIIFSLYIAIYLEFFIEPILQGIPWFFTIFCFINGMITSFNRCSNENYFNQPFR